MTSRFWLLIAAIGIGVSATGCGSSLKVVPVTVTVTPPTVAVAIPQEVPALQVVDPVAILIEKSHNHFVAGEKELAVGHLQQAKAQFDLAIDVLLESPYGARSEPRIREHFDRLVDRISNYEITALTQGDGFVEQASQPASIDELLAISTFERPAPTAELENAVKSDLASTTHDIEIPLNKKVLSYIELFQTRLHDWFDMGMRRSARYLPMIQSVFRAEGLPLDLAYVPLIESAFSPNAQSRARAKGLWQFMAATGKMHGLKQDWYIDERSDPEKATRAAAAYLKTLSGMFDGDWHLALASYNGGPGRVSRAQKRARKTDFWALSQASRYLPRETREYVPMILAAIVIAKNPGQYGFDPEPEGPLAYEKVAISDPVDLRRIAEWTNASIDDIQTLNPELRRWTTPVRYPEYELKVPAGSADALRDHLADASAEELTTLQWHTVKKGESLLSISRKLNVKQTDLMDANYLSRKAKVMAGQRLVIPRAPTTLLASTPEATPVTDNLVAVSQPTVEGMAMVASNPKPEVASDQLEKDEPQKIVYRVRRGDTLFAIARLYNTTVDALKTWNSRIRGNRINVGDRLTIFSTRLAN